MTNQGRLTIGAYTIFPAFGFILAGAQQTITVECIPELSGKCEEVSATRNGDELSPIYTITTTIVSFYSVELHRILTGRLLLYVHDCQYTYVKSCQDLSSSVKIWYVLSRSDKICQDLTRSVQICQDLVRSVKICQDLSMSVHVCEAPETCPADVETCGPRGPRDGETRSALLQVLSIDVTGRDQADHPQGIPYRLLADACQPGISTGVKQTSSIFEEHRICKNLSIWQHTHRVSEACAASMECLRIRGIARSFCRIHVGLLDLGRSYVGNDVTHTTRARVPTKIFLNIDPAALVTRPPVPCCFRRWIKEECMVRKKTGSSSTTSSLVTE